MAKVGSLRGESRHVKHICVAIGSSNVISYIYIYTSSKPDTSSDLIISLSLWYWLRSSSSSVYGISK
ncbi:hypothetical protein Bca4012_064967 [Brassica carinata]